MLFYLLFLFYFMLACLLISRSGFMKRSGLSASALLLLFTIKVAAGIFIGWYSNRYYPDATDYYGNNNGGWVEYQIMLLHPKEFLLDFLQPRYEGFGNFFGSVNSYWNDLETNIILKFLAIFNIFSRGNYYINSIFFNCFAFFGHVAFYRVFASVYKHHRPALIAGCFLLPSTLLFTSGINKDNIIFALLGLLLFLVQQVINTGFTVKKMVLLLLFFTGILLIRNYVAILLMPGLAAWLICRKSRLNPWKIYATVYAVVLAVCVFLSLAVTSLNPARIIYQKQLDFLALPPANTQLPVDTLQPTTTSLLIHLPQAVDHVLLRPYVWRKQPPLLIILALEWGTYLLLMGLALWFTLKNRLKIADCFVLFGVIYAVSVMVLIGYIVPAMGAIARYRSLYLPLLITPMLCTAYRQWTKYIKFKNI